MIYRGVCNWLWTNNCDEAKRWPRSSWGWIVLQVGECPTCPLFKHILWWTCFVLHREHCWILQNKISGYKPIHLSPSYDTFSMVLPVATHMHWNRSLSSSPFVDGTVMAALFCCPHKLYFQWLIKKPGFKVTSQMIYTEAMVSQTRSQPICLSFMLGVYICIGHI